ncbi:major facilitator superfamily transporter [Diaporthe helianthi]|uniref:Major facilitator superfamily transporter n=1 Tax=Diaporthe helianthi TaxID=158607 RepID=A0A2P5HXW3_DIAHE|nr:major facilitator superfamily transporter [Diaporthe helianthi]
MSALKPARGERQPLLREVPPVPIQEGSGPSPDDLCHAHEHDTSHPRTTSTAAKILATTTSFLVLGMLISTPGVVLPHLESHYHLTDVRASLVFLVAPWGYLAGAYLNDPLHRRLGQRGIAAIAPICQAIFTSLAATFHDPQGAGFEVFLAATVCGNVGAGLVDGSWCAWAGGLGGGRRNFVQGLLHGCFSVGAGLGPFLAGTLFSVYQRPWWEWYYVLLGAVVLQAVVLLWVFRFDDGARYRDALVAPKLTSGTTTIDRASAAPPSAAAGRAGAGALRYAVTWICAVYFLVYVGTEAAISGWVVTFMLRARHASTYVASLSSSGFWIGMAVGRLLLGLVTDKVGVRVAATVYVIIAIAAQAVVAAVDLAAVSIAAVIVVGFFLGPLFPSGIVVLARLLPKDLHVGAVSFVASVGQLGAAFGPFAMGALVQLLGIRTFQFFILALLVVALLIWLMFPRLPHGETDSDSPGSTESTGP